MRIVHFIGTNFVGGPEKQILNHLQRLESSKYTVLIITFAETGGVELQKRAEKLGIECRLFPAAKWSILPVLRELKVLVTEWKPDIVCGHGYKAGLYSLLLRNGGGYKYIGFSRGWTTESLTVRLYGIIDRILIRFADRIVAVSKSQKRRLQRILVPNSKITVINNAVTLQVTTPISPEEAEVIKLGLGLKARDRIVITAGRLSPEKGHTHLLGAMDTLMGEMDDIHLFIAGDGILRRKLEQQQQVLRYKERVHFLGFQSDIIRLFLIADLFVLPSLSEGLPNVLLEAMSHKLPVVATNVGGIPELVDHGRTGLIVESRDSEALAQAMLKLLKDSGLAMKLSENAERYVKECYDGDRQTEKLVQLYRDVYKAS